MVGSWQTSINSRYWISKKKITCLRHIKTFPLLPCLSCSYPWCISLRHFCIRLRIMQFTLSPSKLQLSLSRAGTALVSVLCMSSPFARESINYARAVYPVLYHPSGKYCISHGGGCPEKGIDERVEGKSCYSKTLSLLNPLFLRGVQCPYNVLGIVSVCAESSGDLTGIMPCPGYEVIRTQASARS